ncbi:MAG: hypothetical protein JRF33_04050 [Deltaproteobacteria bacterium]|nr:hypothetical protein [Deltaproteobacteria bacterium]
MDKAIIIGLLGETQDWAPKKERWDRWRPTVALCMHKDWPVQRFYLLHGATQAKLSKRLSKDIGKVSPATKVNRVELAEGSEAIHDQFLALSDKIKSTWVHGNTGQATIQSQLLSSLINAGKASGLVITQAPDAKIPSVSGRLLRFPFEGPVKAGQEPKEAEAELPDGLDEFDRFQLAGVLKICQSSPSLSEAGRRLFAQSRQRKAKPNDADRLRKYLARFKLRFQDLKSS